MNTNESVASIHPTQWQLILHVVRHWMTTIAAAQRRLRPEASVDAVRKDICRTVEGGWLSRHILFGQEPYFMLTPKVLAVLGIRRSIKPLGHQALLEHFGVLLACVRRKCDVFTEDEFLSRYPHYAQAGFSLKNYFLDGALLANFVVDHDKSTKRLLDKIGRFIAKVLDKGRPEFRQLILNGQFAFHVITATEAKRANIEDAIKRKAEFNVPVFVEAYPDDLTDFFFLNRR